MQRTKRQKTLKPNTVLLENGAGETVASIDNILTQILLKVPIKTLVRFKLVDKRWFSIITSNEFCLMRNPAPNPAQGIVFAIKFGCNYTHGYFPLDPPNSFKTSINLRFTAAPNSPKVLNSCKGLLLCCSFKSWKFDTPTSDLSVYVYNPTTKVSAALPQLPDGIRRGVTLVFDPIKSPHYEVVLVTTGLSVRTQIYSSETGVWSDGGEISKGNMYKDRVDFVKGVYCNGFIHWLSQNLSPKLAEPSLRFHVGTRVFHEMPSPPVLQHTRRTYNYYGEPLVLRKTHGANNYFGESCDHLHFIEPILPCFNVYEMKMDYSEWFVKYKVDLSLFIGEYPEVTFRRVDFIYVLSLVRGENDEDSNLVLRIPGKAIKFNIVDGSSEKLYTFTHHDIDRGAGYSFLKQLERGYMVSGSGDVGNKRYMFIDEYGLDYIQSLCNV